MSFQNTVKHSNGEILTGKLWRKDHSFFNGLPFYSNIPRMDDIAGSLQVALGNGAQVKGCYRALLVKFGKGLDEGNPFSDTTGVEVVLQEAKKMLSANLDNVGRKYAARIWGYLSKFVMLDRFCKTLGAAGVYPSPPMPKKTCSLDYLGTASKILDEINPPTKLLGKFLRTWEEREKKIAQYSIIAPPSSSVDGQEPADVALALSKRLIAAVKVKNILNIETGLEMIALAIAISSENDGVFPEKPFDVGNVLKRMWADRIDAKRLEDISIEIQSLHRSMKNAIEIVFATSPLLALSTRGWAGKFFDSNYLLKIFLALGNERPQILVQLEDCILETIMAISEGTSRENSMQKLYSELLCLEKTLTGDKDALTWFDLLKEDSDIPSNLPPSTSSAEISDVIQDNLRRRTEEPVTPPRSHYNGSRKPSSLSSAPPTNMIGANLTAALVSLEDRSEKSKADRSIEDETESEPMLIVESNATMSDKEVYRMVADAQVSKKTSLDQIENKESCFAVAIESNATPSKNEECCTAAIDKTKTLNSMDVEESCPEVGVQSKEPTVSLDSITPAPLSWVRVHMQTKKPPQGGIKKLDDVQSDDDRDSILSDHVASTFELRRSARLAPKAQTVSKPVTSDRHAGRKKKTALRKAMFRLQADSDEERPKLIDVGKATYHPTFYAEITGWGSTVEAGPKPFRHVPVQIVSPGNIASTGDDTETLRNVETRIQADFKNGLPPHLQPDSKSLEYMPGSDQSRIYVTSHSEFSALHARDIQKILRDRLILVHGNPLDYNYRWDLESFGRVYDVDKTTTVQVSTKFHPHKPDLRHHQGTLRDLHNMTNSLSSDDCPPLNAISLPSFRRNLYIPCQFGSMASHEVAQSRVPPEYESAFEVPDLRTHLEWSLIGTRGAISPFHVDSEGLGTVVMVLEGSKYWIIISRFGEEEDQICSVDSLGPAWNPYFVNEGDNVNRFRFEGVHLQKGDMLIMPGGVPHWVLGTSNSMCVGRHFYSGSTIRSSVIALLHTFLLGGAATNEEHQETRTLLYQMLVFWSMRIDKTDVDGAHIPDLSTEEGILDIIYLGIFAILSPAFDVRFYLGPKTPTNLIEEVAHAVLQFHSLLHIFSLRFIVLLEGELVTHSYIVDRMLGEFAAAAVGFAKAMDGFYEKDDNKGQFGITSSAFVGLLEGILRGSHPNIFSYYSRCLDRNHKHFLWTGPKLQVLPRSEVINLLVPLATNSELLDLPGHQIYDTNVDLTSSTSSIAMVELGKRRSRDSDSFLVVGHPEKRRR